MNHIGLTIRFYLLFLLTFGIFPLFTKSEKEEEVLLNRDVIIPSLFDFDLEGTLRLPVGSSSTNPVPGVILIHGSGPQSRDEIVPGQANLLFGFNLPVFANIGDSLQDAGIAVLTYDKRSCGTFNNCSNNNYTTPDPDDDIEFTVDIFMEDAISAASWLLDQPEIDRVIVIGHSQGGQFIPEILYRRPDFDSGIILAGPFNPIDDILKFQLNFTYNLLLSTGMTEEDAIINPGIVGLQDLINDLSELRNGSTNITSIAGLSSMFWTSWFDITTRALDVASDVTQPMLIINGELDWNVPVPEAYAWKDYLLNEAGLPQDQVKLITFPCITHVLNCVNESNPLLIKPENIGRQVSSEVIDSIAMFVLDGSSPSSVDVPTIPTAPTITPTSDPTMSPTTSSAATSSLINYYYFYYYSTSWTFVLPMTVLLSLTILFN